MPNQTSRLHLNTWLESETVDFEEVNANFTALDNMCLCYESGTLPLVYTGGAGNPTSWHYKKYADRTVELAAKLEFTNIKCNGGAAAPYYSGSSSITIPIALSEVYDLQMHLASNTIGWVSDISNRAIASDNYITFRVMSMGFETEYIYKQVFVSLKGVMA